MIWIIGGTRDGLDLLEAIEKTALNYLYTVTTSYGQAKAAKISGRAIVRQMDQDQMEAFIAEEAISLIIDASHPFSSQVSLNAMGAAESTGTIYKRLEREAMAYPAYVTLISSLEDLAGLEAGQEDVIYISTGTNDLKTYLDLFPKERLVARVLPNSESIRICEGLGLSPGQVHAIYPPYSYELNQALFSKAGAGALVSKDSGKAGGLEDKLRAAHDMGMRVYVIARPQLDYPEIYTNIGDLLASIEEE